MRGFCDKVLWLEKGRQMAYGEPGPVIEQYVASRSG